MEKTESKTKERANCNFCGRGKSAQICGTLYFNENCTAHKRCMQYSASLAQYHEKYKKFGGFKVNETVEEVQRGKPLKCSLCGISGATCGCAYSLCKSSFHFPCAHDDPSAVVKRFVVTSKTNEGEVWYRVFCSEKHLKLYKEKVEKKGIHLKESSLTQDSNSDDGTDDDADDFVIRPSDNNADSKKRTNSAHRKTSKAKRSKTTSTNSDGLPSVGTPSLKSKLSSYKGAHNLVASELQDSANNADKSSDDSSVVSLSESSTSSDSFVTCPPASSSLTPIPTSFPLNPNKRTPIVTDVSIADKSPRSDRVTLSASAVAVSNGKQSKLTPSVPIITNGRQSDLTPSVSAIAGPHKPSKGATPSDFTVVSNSLAVLLSTATPASASNKHAAVIGEVRVITNSSKSSSHRSNVVPVSCKRQLAVEANGHSTKLHKCSTMNGVTQVKVEDSVTEDDNSQTSQSSSIPSLPEQCTNNASIDDCIVCFAFVFDPTVNVTLGAKSQQVWNISPRRVYTWQPPDSTVLHSLPSFIFYLHQLSLKLCDSLQPPAGISETNSKKLEKLIFDWTAEDHKECESWVKAAESSGEEKACIEYRECRADISRRVENLNKRTGEVIAHIVDNTLYYALYLRLCHATDASQILRLRLPRYTRRAKLLRVPVVAQSNGDGNCSSSRASANTVNADTQDAERHRQVELASLRQWLHERRNSFTAGGIHLLPVDECLQGVCPSQSHSLATQLYTALLGDVRAKSNNDFATATCLAFFYGPTASESLLPYDKYVLHSMPHLVNKHVSAITSVIFVFDVSDAVFIDDAVSQLPRHVSCLCWACFRHDQCVPAISCVIVECRLK